MGRFTLKIPNFYFETTIENFIKHSKIVILPRFCPFCHVFANMSSTNTLNIQIYVFFDSRKWINFSKSENFAKILISVNWFFKHEERPFQITFLLLDLITIPQRQPKVDHDAKETTPEYQKYWKHHDAKEATIKQVSTVFDYYWL